MPNMPVLLKAVSVFVFLAVALAYSGLQAHATGLTQSANVASSSGQYFSTAASGNALDITGDLTVLSWVKFNSLPDSTHDNYEIAGHYNNGSLSQSQWTLGFIYESGTYKLRLALSNSSSHNEPKVGWTPSVGVWHQVAAVYDAGNQTATFYVDGSQIGSAQSVPFSSLNTSTKDFLIGALGQNSAPDPYYFLDGRVSQVAVFNAALSSAVIAGYYCAQLTGSETGLVGLWNLDNSTIDSGPNGYNLTAHNGPSFPSDVPSCLRPAPTSVRKSTLESVANSSVLQYDDDLQLDLSANSSYVVDGVVFVSATTSSATPDFVMGFGGPSGSTITIGADDQMLMGSTTSARMILPRDTSKAVHIQGTVTTGSSSGKLRLEWAQSTANSAPTTVLAGSYMRIESI